MTPRNTTAPRHKCGRIIQPPPEESEEEARRVALAQPHRKGSRDQLCVDAVGRFIRKRRLRSEIAAAADRYKIVRQDWLTAFGYPPGERLEMVEAKRTAQGPGESSGPSWRTIRRWRRKLDRWEAAARKADALGWRALRLAMLDGLDIPLADEDGAAKAIIALAVATGKLSDRRHPFL